ncbi:MAG: hypothetical protein ACLR0V_06395 [Roseburia hominis]
MHEFMMFSESCAFYMYCYNLVKMLLGMVQDGASYDIETDDKFIEVKSTLSRSKREITVNNQFQLDTSK